MPRCQEPKKPWVVTTIKLLPLVVLGVFVTVIAVLSTSSAAPSPKDDGLYQIGVGRYDITGPAADVNMMGYANPSQISNGIHIRLFSRAFIIDDGNNRVVFVSADMGMMATSIKLGVMERLTEEFGEIYTSQNVILSGTHTHSGPGGYLQYLLYDITSLGFVQESYDATVEGVFQSIKRAHESMGPGRLYLSAGEVQERANINRSPQSYDNNPADELSQYKTNTDINMTLLKFISEDGTELGMVNWFAVHPTSMNNTNTLISGDNKGYASQLFEKQMDPKALAGKGSFVAAFAQSNCGDVSPNTDGPKCQDTGIPCDTVTSTCGGRVQKCYAAGPGVDMEDSTRIIGEMQFKKAMELYNDESSTMITGPVASVAQHIDMSNYSISLPNGMSLTTCKPALGYSFAAGTTDGPGAFNFTQGMTSGNDFWNAVVNFIKPVSIEQIACHSPKPVLLDTGNFNKPYPWHPNIVETQIAKIGQLVVAAVPGEFTTMAGRRLRKKISETFAAGNEADIVPVIAGLSNDYTHYITTSQEYEIQRYEGASTLYGPYTLDAYLQQYTLLANSLITGESLPLGPNPPNLIEDQFSLLPSVPLDGTQDDDSFGDVIAQPYPLAVSGETVMAKFVAGHPRNDVMLGDTFLMVQRKDGENWLDVANDADWSTKFIWDRTLTLTGTSVATVTWTIPADVTLGTYRIIHTGNWKAEEGTTIHYVGVTNEFEVALLDDEPVFEPDILDWFKGNYNVAEQI